MKDRLIGITKVVTKALPAVNIEWHHLLPLQYAAKLDKVGLNINQWMVPLTEEVHKGIHGEGVRRAVLEQLDQTMGAILRFNS